MSDIAVPRFEIKELIAALEYFETKQRAVAVEIKFGDRSQILLSHNERDGVSTTITIYRTDGDKHGSMRMPEKTTTERFCIIPAPPTR